jgi:hypothetical protein
MEVTVPIVWGYFLDEVIGSAVVEADGTVTMTLTDPRIKDIVEADKLRGLCISHRPALARLPSTGNQTEDHIIKGEN